MSSRLLTTKGFIKRFIAGTTTSFFFSYNTLIKNIGKADKLLLKSYTAQYQAEAMFYKLSNRAAEECADALRIVLRAKKSLQKYILGVKYDLTDETIKKVIKSIFEEPEEIEYHYNMERTFEGFVKYEKGIQTIAAANNCWRQSYYSG